MTGPSADYDWRAYNATQTERQVRQLCRDVIELAGPGHGRVAVDLAAGRGRETRALLDAGWQVHAYDRSADSCAMIRETCADVPAERWSVTTSDFAALGREGLPAVDLVHASFGLPFAGDDLDALWGRIRRALRPDGWIAATFFGPRDSWHDTPGIATRSRDDVTRMCSGLEIVGLDETDEDGQATSGPKHWHVFQLIARG